MSLRAESAVDRCTAPITSPSYGSANLALPGQPRDVGSPGVRRTPCTILPPGFRLPRRQRVGQRVESPQRCVCDEFDAAPLAGIERIDVEIDEPRVAEHRMRTRGEIGQPRADRKDDIGFRGECVGGRRSRHADGAELQRVIPWQRSLAGLCFREPESRALPQTRAAPPRQGHRERRRLRRAWAVSQRAAPPPLVRVPPPRAAAHEKRWSQVRRRIPDSRAPSSARPAAARASPARTAPGRSARSPPAAALRAAAQGGRCGRKSATRGRKQSLAVTVPSSKSSICCNTGSGARDTNTSPGRNRTGKRFTCASAAAVTRLVAPGPMDVVAGHHPAAEIGLRIRDGRMRHRLLVVRAIRGQQCAVRVQGLTHARDVAVAEDREHGGEERRHTFRCLGAQCREIADERLRRRQPHGVHALRSARRGGLRAIP